MRPARHSSLLAMALVGVSVCGVSRCDRGSDGGGDESCDAVDAGRDGGFCRPGRISLHDCFCGFFLRI